MNIKIGYSEDITDTESLKPEKTLDPENVDLIFLFPTTEGHNAKDLETLSKKLQKKYNCDIAGVSVGGISTHLNDGITSINGVAALFISNTDYNTSRIEDSWRISKEKFLETLSKDKTNFVFDTGARSSKSGIKWSIAKKMASRVIETNTFNQRGRLIKKLQEYLKKNEISYPDTYSYILSSTEYGNTIVKFDSGDTGDFQKGYEIWNEQITESSSCTVLRTNKNIDQGVACTAKESTKSERVLEEFDNIERYRKIIYKLGGKTIPELNKEYPLDTDINGGGLSLYMVIETEKGYYSVPFEDLGLIFSPIDFETCKKAYLVKAPSWEEYKEKTQKMIQQIDGSPQISINPPQMMYFREKINEIENMIDSEFNEYLLTIDNKSRQIPGAEYNFPGYIDYK